ncbi:MAG: NAD(P)-binding protein [Rhodospirillales bacterium]|nr:NAD(P)-binding protein [Rhodospirillales bacterium]
MNLHGSSKARIAVIGSGMAGIGCAKNLKQHGFHPTIFEKSRGLGGRLVTRRMVMGSPSTMAPNTSRPARPRSKA